MSADPDSLTCRTKVSMNGLRRILSRDVETLRDIVQEVVSGDCYDRDDLVEAMNQVITGSNVLNCVYYGDDPDFKDMGDVEIEPIETDGEGQ